MHEGGGLDDGGGRSRQNYVHAFHSGEKEREGREGGNCKCL